MHRKQFKSSLINGKVKNLKSNDLIRKYKQLLFIKNLKKDDKINNLGTLIKKWLELSQLALKQLFNLINFNNDLIFKEFLIRLSIEPSKLNFNDEFEDFDN